MTYANAYFDMDYLGIENYEGYGCSDSIYAPKNAQDAGVNYNIESYTGLGCSTSNCGGGRENGYSSTYLTIGCRSWQLIPAYTPFYNYYIDMESLEGLSSVEQQLFINSVHEAVDIWNSIRIYDGNGQIIQLVETEPGSLYVPKVNLCPIKYNPSLDDGCLGIFYPIPAMYNIQIKEIADTATVLHELGHLLGLQDLDRNNSMPYPHHTLMGYGAKNDHLHYQDIQGVAVSSGMHQDHDFSRYIIDGNTYKHVCFYCDLIDTETTPKANALPLEEAANCVHDYKQMVSAGERHWLKCTKCYKVVETEWSNYFTPNDGTFIYKLTDNCFYTITGLIDTTISNIVISPTFDGKEVRAIDDEAFENCTNLTTVNIPMTITRIGASAFKDCENLVSIILPSKLTSIEDRTFFGCSKLVNISLPNTLEIIGSEAFSFCVALKKIVVPDKVTLIKDGTFSFCLSLSSVSLPSGLKRIGSCAFLCTDIATINIPDSVRSIDASAFGLCYNLSEIILPNSVTYLGESIFNGCYNLEDVILSNSITIIPENTFSGCTSLENIAIFEGVEEIGKNAFKSCSGLASISLPYSLKVIEEGAFSDCTGFQIFTINLGSNPIIGKNAFKNCTNLVEVNLPIYGIEIIGEGAFRECSSLAKINLPYSLTSIEEYLFYGCSSLANVIIHNGITHIGDYAFYGTGFTKIILPNSVSDIGENVFTESEIAEIKVANGNSYYSSQNGILYNKNKTTLIYVPEKISGGATISSGVTTIASEAFKGRIGLTSITIPSSVTSIGSNAFEECANLTIYVENIVSEPNGWNMSWNVSNRPVFWGCVFSTTDDYVLSFAKTTTSIENSNAAGGISVPYREGYQFDGWATGIDEMPIYTVANVVNATNNTTLYAVWTDLAISSFKFTLINSNTAYEIAVKDGITLTGEVTIPSSYNGLPVTKIASYGFMDYAYVNSYADTSGITMINIPNSILHIDEYSFAGCENLKNVIFADNSNIIYIGAGAFSGCRELESIVIPRSVKSIDELAFYQCEKLCEVIFEENSQLITLSNNIFDSCRALVSIELPDGITYMGTYIFENCEGLIYAKLPENILEIPEGTFMWCGLTDIEIPSMVTKIGENAFFGCTLNDINISDKITEIGKTAFAKCGLNTISVASRNQYYKSDNNCLIRIDDNVLLNGSNLSIIPSYVEIIDQYAFSGCIELEYIKIPNSVTMICDYAFFGCQNLNSVVFEATDQAISIGNSVFGYCLSLESINILEQVVTMGHNIFWNCGNLTIYAEPTNELLGWDEYWNNENRPIVWGINLSTNGEYVVSFTKTENSFSNYTEENGISAPYRDSYMFDGWYTNQSYTGIKYSEFDIISASNNVSYYAKWMQPECMINYYDIGEETFSGTYDVDYPIIHKYGTVTLLSIPSKTGYVFGGWYSNVEGTGNPITALSARGYSDDIILYAKWIPETYTITYNDVGNVAFSGMHNTWYPKIHIYGMPTILDIPNKEGYIFKGWYLSSNGDGEYLVELSETDYTSDVTLYAKWSLPPVIYNLLSDGTGYEAAKGGDIEGEIEILSLYNGLPVVQIASAGFRNCKEMTSVIMPSSIVTINNYAFSGCSGLKNVNIPANVTNIGDSTFADCQQLTSIFIPASVIELGENIFYNCTTLVEINVDQKNNHYSSLDGVLFDKMQTELLIYPLAKKGRYEVPRGITHIGDYAFANSSALTEILISKDVEIIEECAFENCDKLKNVEFEMECSLITIENSAFHLCSELETIYFMGLNLDYIGYNAFRECRKLKSIILPKNLTTISYCAFAGCTNLEWIQIPLAVTHMDDSVFEDWQEQQVIYVEGGIDVEDYWNEYWNLNCNATIYWCGYEEIYTEGLEFISIDNGTAYEVSAGISLDNAENGVVIIPAIFGGLPVTRIADYGFSETSVEEVVIQQNGNLKEIGEYAFANCGSLQKINLPEGVENIAEYAFSNCSSLQNIIIPSSVVTIENGVFVGCSSLGSIVLPDSVVYIEYDAFDSEYGYTIYSDATSIPENWRFTYNTSNYNIILKCTLSWDWDNAYVFSIEYTLENFYNYDLISPPYRQGYIFEGWSTVEDGEVEYYLEDLYYENVSEGMILYAVWSLA